MVANILGKCVPLGLCPIHFIAYVIKLIRIGKGSKHTNPALARSSEQLNIINFGYNKYSIWMIVS